MEYDLNLYRPMIARLRVNIVKTDLVFTNVHTFDVFPLSETFLDRKC